MSVLPVRPGRAGLLQDHLLVQASADAANIAAPLANRSGSGIVLSGPQALTAALRLTKTTPGLPLLCDRRRYAGKSRASRPAPFDPRWLDGQRELNVPHVLSDSGYIGCGDVRALVAVLDQAVAAGQDVTAVLPVHASWLRGDLSTFISEVSAHSVPIALVLEHRADPLSVLETVRGLVTLIRQVPAVRAAVQRCVGTGCIGLRGFMGGRGSPHEPPSSVSSRRWLRFAGRHAKRSR